MRARELGITVGTGTPGPHNAITDVHDVRVGSTTLIEGERVRTGVTVVLPHAGDVFTSPLHAGFHWLNGNGELTGTAWIQENGLLMSPIGVTNTGSAGPCRSWGRPGTASSTTSTATTPTTPPPPARLPKATSAAAPA